MLSLRLATLASLLYALAALAQPAPFSKDDRITPGRVGLPNASTRTSEPFVQRVYKTDEAGIILKKQPDGYPFTVTADYDLKANEAVRVHQGVDLSSRLEPGKPARLEFKAGVHGTVVKAGDGPWGTITVQLADGTLVQYLHTSIPYVKVGDVVAPDTKLGVTGHKGASAIHLHIQAKDANGNPISPDLAFRAGQRKLEMKVKPERPTADEVEFDPDAHAPVKPNVKGNRVSPKVQPAVKWVVEVIGMGGRVDLVLGDCATYSEALYCARLWSAANPNDLRLTREREVKLAGK